MLKLHSIFLRKLTLLLLALFVALWASLYFWIKDIYIEQTRISLLSNIDIFASQIDQPAHADALVKTIKKQTGIRTTIINANGTVIAESDHDKRTMDNHKNRSEVIAAHYHPYGWIMRQSDTLKKEMLYVAKKVIIGGVDYTVRMARDLDKITDKFVLLSLKVGGLFGLFGLFALWFMLTISRNIERETNAILYFLDRLTKYKKSMTIDSDYSQEFYKITKLLTEVSAKLAKRQKQKDKYTARLKLANRQKDDIISAISHEFKNPIAVISGYSQTLVDDKEISPKIREKFLDKIHTNAHKLTHMIDRLRLAIVLEESKQSYNFTLFSLNRVVEEARENLLLSYPDREITIRADKEVQIKADETLMLIAITNLIENALKYSQDAVTVTIDDHTISVQDNGIGIKEKEIPRITKKFYRISTNHWNNSLGLGLSLVANILKVHNFDLDIVSKEHQGSTFTVRFQK